MTRERISWKAALVVVLLTAGAFSPLLSGGFEFVNLDDPEIVYENPRFLRDGGPSLDWMFSITAEHMGHFQPLTWLSLALDLHLFGLDNPSAWHIHNLVLHLGSALLAFMVCTLLLRLVLPNGDKMLSTCAAVGALLFAIHPLRVESVAWVTERRDVLSGLFYLATLYLYLHRLEGGPTDAAERRRSFITAIPMLLVFTCSMLAKAWGITFFVVLLLLDFYPLRRFGREDVSRILLEKVPFVVISLPIALAASHAQSLAGAVRSFATHDLMQRTAQAAYGLCFYVGTTVWPSDLSCLYSLPFPPGIDPFSPIHVAGMIVAPLVAVVVVLCRHRLPWLFVALFAFAVIVSPVLGFTQSGPQKVADRYTYVSCLPFAMLGAGAMLWLLRRGWAREHRIAVLCIPAAVILSFGAQTFLQIETWRNSVTLWENAYRVNPRCGLGVYNLGRAYDGAGRYDDAVRYYRLACKAAPRAANPRRDLGIVLAERLKRHDEAIAEFEILLRHHRRDQVAYVSIGICHQSRNRFPEARDALLAAIALPGRNLELAHRKLAETYLALGKPGKAAEQRARADRLRRGPRRP